MKVNLTKSLGQSRSGSVILHPCPLDELIQVFVLRGGDVLRKTMISELVGLGDVFEGGIEVIDV
jgi:hypothetical protein